MPWTEPVFPPPPPPPVEFQKNPLQPVFPPPLPTAQPEIQANSVGSGSAWEQRAFLPVVRQGGGSPLTVEAIVGDEGDQEMPYNFVFEFLKPEAGRELQVSHGFVLFSEQ